MNEKENELPDCCKKDKSSLSQGLLYGLIPHIGCIAFIIGSVLGVTVLMNFFKPILMNRYFFHALIGVSLGFAGLSSVLYLRKNKLLSVAGAKKKWKYLTVMFGSTVGINLLLFLVIFPMLANIDASGTITGGAVLDSTNEKYSTITLTSDIPCSGHAPLITQELKTLDGIFDIKFSFPNKFDVKFDSSKTSKEKILGLEIFKTYKAEEVNKK